MNSDPTLQDWTVLVVDDEADASEVVRLLLEGCGAEVILAPSAEHALSILTETNQQMTAIVADLALPNMTGWDLLKALKATPALSQIPAVAVTAYHSTTTAREATQAGFAAYFSKPINSKTFVEDLIKAINTSVPN